MILFPKTAKPSSEILSIIELTNMCELFSSLPKAGGVLDQDAETILHMQFVLVAKQEKREQEAKAAKRGVSGKRT